MHGSSTMAIKCEAIVQEWHSSIDCLHSVKAALHTWGFEFWVDLPVQALAGVKGSQLFESGLALGVKHCIMLCK